MSANLHRLPYPADQMPPGVAFIVPYARKKHLVEFYDKDHQLIGAYDDGKNKFRTPKQIARMKGYFNVMPPVFEVKFTQFEDHGVNHVRVTHGKRRLGNDLNDNSRQEDGYRFHDSAHFIHLTMTGQSNVVGFLMQGPRAAKPHFRTLTETMQTDFEEAWPLMAHMMRGKKGFVEEDKPTNTFLGLLTGMAETARVSTPPSKKEMGKIVQEFYKAMDFLKAHDGGSMLCDTVNKTIQYKGPNG